MYVRPEVSDFFAGFFESGFSSGFLFLLSSSGVLFSSFLSSSVGAVPSQNDLSTYFFLPDAVR
jgi:hypothetical protein